MTIHESNNDNICTLSIEGRIDTITAPELEQAVANHEEGCNRMILDLSGVDYISSAGLRVLVFAHREMNKKDGLVIKNPSKNVDSILKLTGFSRKLNIE